MPPNTLSIVIPLFNEADSLSELHRRLAAVLAENLPDWQAELLFVNDGSTDTTADALTQIAESDRRVLIISLPKNQGKSHALAAGFRQASGASIVTLDGDLQDRPENIPQLLAALHDPYDLVVGWKRIRHDPLVKIILSKLFNRCIRLIWQVPLHDSNCGMKAMRRPVAQTLLTLTGGAHRFIPIFAQRAGFRLTEVPITHDARKHGRSKYGWWRVVDGFTSFVSLLLWRK